MGKKQILINLQNALEKKYKIRRTGENGRSFEVTVPKEVLEREARRLRVSFDDLVAVWKFNDFHGLYMEIVREDKV